MMKKFRSNPILNVIWVLICANVLTLPALIFVDEKSTLISVMASAVFLGSTYFVQSFFIKSYSEATLYKRSNYTWLSVILFLCLAVISFFTKRYDLSLYYHSNVLYCGCVFIAMISLAIALIAKNKNKYNSDWLYKVSVILLWIVSAFSCLSLFKSGEEWIF